MAIIGLSTGNDAASASSNVQVLQTALNKGGLVQVPDSGTYLFNATLLIKTGTTLELGNGVIFKQYAGTNDNMIRNVGAMPVGNRKVVSSLTSSGTTVTLSTGAVPHGFIIGDYIVVHGSDSFGYNGVYRVQTVPSATSVTYTAEVVPADTTAVVSPRYSAFGITVRKADRNITIRGGQWMKNRPENQTPNVPGCTILIDGVQGFELRDTFVIDSSYRALFFIQARDFLIDGFGSDDTRVILQTNGALHNGQIRNIVGTTIDDDGLALMAREADGFPQNLTSHGDIVNVEVANVSINALTHAMVVYNFRRASDAKLTCVVRGVKLTNITGANRGRIVAFKNAAGNEISEFHDIVVDGIHGMGTDLFYSEAVGASLTVKNVTGHYTTTGVSVVTQGFRDVLIDGFTAQNQVTTNSQSAIIVGGVATRNVTVRNAVSDYGAVPGAGADYVSLQSGNALEMVRVENMYINAGANTSAVVPRGAVAGTIMCDNVRVISGRLSNVLFAVNKFKVRNCVVTGSANSFSVAANVALEWDGYTTSGGTNWINITAGAVSMIGGGLLLNGMAQGAATGTVSLQSFNIPWDINSANTVRAIGNFCYNTNAAVGTPAAIGVGPAVCTTAAAGGWKPVNAITVTNTF